MAVGVGLAVAYFAAFLWFQLFVGRRSPTLMPALTVAGFVLRLTLFAVILFLLAWLTDLNIIATGVAFVVVYTALSAWGIHLRIKAAKRADGASDEAVTANEAADSARSGARAVNGPKGA